MGRPTEETTYTELTSSSMLQSQPPPLPPLRENEPVITADQVMSVLMMVFRLCQLSYIVGYQLLWYCKLYYMFIL